MKTFNRVLVVAALFTPAISATTNAPARADAIGDVSRTVVKNYGAGAVTLIIVLKASSGDDQAEREIEGIVLDANGLIVTANTNVDPGAAYAAMSGDESYATKVVSVKIITASGEEVPARVVLRDKDRNLAFLRPLQKPKTAFTPISFARKNTAQVGDAIFILGRLGKTGGRQASITSQRVVSVIQKPRRMFVVLPDMYSSMGNVVFNAAGQPLGLLTARIGLKSSDAALPVVVPASDVMEIARQAPSVGKAKKN